MTERPGPIMDNFFASFGTTEFLVRQSIVPVVAWNDDDEEIRCIGTGFFISASGLLMTVAHVLRDPVDDKYTRVTQIDKNTHKLDEALHFGILLPANPAMRNAPFQMPHAMRNATWFMCPFEWTTHWGKEVESPLPHEKPEFKPTFDIAICKVREQPVIGGSYQPLNISMHNLKLGDRAVAIGYAEMRITLVDLGRTHDKSSIASWKKPAQYDAGRRRRSYSNHRARPLTTDQYKLLHARKMPEQ